MTPEQIKNEREIAYNRKMLRSTGRAAITLLSIVFILGIICVMHPSVGVKVKSVVKSKPDTVYMYYRGEQGYIRFHKPKDFNPIFDHSEIIKDSIK